MYDKKTIFSQIMDFIPTHEFNKCVQKYEGNYRVRSFTCRSHFYVMAFAQLTYRESLRDIEASLNAFHNKLYHLGIRSKISKSTIADANDKRDWRIYADFAQVLIKIARPLYKDDDIGIDLDQMVYALDSSTIDLCLTLFPWAKFRKKKAAIKLHTLLDLHGNIPVFISITEGKIQDVNILDILIPEQNAIYLIDRGYIDFSRLYNLTQNNSYFITRAKSNLNYRVLDYQPVDKTSGLRCDQTICLTGINTSKKYPERLRRIHYYDKENKKKLIFLTNNFILPALSIAKLYKSRWQVELFFKWIKQHLRIKSFYGTSVNAVKVQIWTAICIYLLIIIIKRKFKLTHNIYTILQVLSVSIFEKTPILEAFTNVDELNHNDNLCKQLNLFEL